MAKLAINGGEKVRVKPFPAYNNIGDEEINAVVEVMKTGRLSQFLGTWHDDFYGGDNVRALEKEWAEMFSVKHAISVNSATSGLYCAVGALDVDPGDEIICSPYTMSASVMAPLVYNCIPVFADVEKDYFCLDPESVEKCITKRTKAIIVVDIFGQPFSKEINKIAEKHGLAIIEDAAQAPYGFREEKRSGTLGDIGVYSLNYHKHIHAGEGGIIVTDDDRLAERMQLIRNHAESVVSGKGVTEIHNLIGFNFRMTEIEAAISRLQLKKLKNLVTSRQENVQYLAQKIDELEGLSPAKVRKDCGHSFYVHAIKYDEDFFGFHRDKFVAALRAELAPSDLREKFGPLISGGYVKPLYLLPLFQEKIAYGKEHFPFSLAEREVNYHRGICKNVEDLHFNELFTHELMYSGLEKDDLDDIFRAFEKVWENRKSLL